jgi:DNA-binding SARP family transcriptional activator
VRISVFGGLTIDGTPRTDLPRPARSLVGVLAARHDRVQSKAALADAIWGSDDHAAVDACVAMLPPSCVLAKAGGYVLSTATVELDLAELRNLVRTADAHPPGSAVRLELREQILALVSAPPFGEDEPAGWAAAPRAEARDAVLAAKVELAESALPGNPARALRLAEEALDLDRYQERTYRIAMRASAALGRTDAALGWFERCRRTLGDELHITPSPQTGRLRLDLLRAREAIPSGPALPPQPADTERFFGRTREIALMLRAGVRVVHLTGPVGAGKTALLATLARRAPGTVGVGTAHDSSDALRLTWLRSALLQLGVVPILDGGRSPVGGGLSRPAEIGHRLSFEAAGRRALTTDELAELAAALPEPALIGVDRADWLDQASVTELAWLSEHCPQLTIVLAYRSAASIAGTPAATLAPDVVLRLAPLSVDELGDPAFLSRTGGIPALVALEEFPVRAPTSAAVDLARARTRAMPPLAWEILEHAATADRVALPEEWRACADELVRAHLLLDDGDGHVRHSSTLIRAGLSA